MVLVQVPLQPPSMAYPVNDSNSKGSLPTWAIAVISIVVASLVATLLVTWVFKCRGRPLFGLEDVQRMSTAFYFGRFFKPRNWDHAGIELIEFPLLSYLLFHTPLHVVCLLVEYFWQ